MLNGPGLEGYRLDGKGKWWDYPWQVGDEMINASQPIAVPMPIGAASQHIFISSGYGKGCVLLDVSNKDGNFSVTEVWGPNKSMKAKFTTPVLHNGFVYGLDNGILACVDLKDGKRTWKKGRYGHGQILLVGDTIVVLTEKGELCLVAANPNEFQELAKIQAIEGKTWNHIALAGRFLLARNSLEAACFRLPIRENQEPSSISADGQNDTSG